MKWKRRRRKKDKMEKYFNFPRCAQGNEKRQKLKMEMEKWWKPQVEDEDFYIVTGTKEIG
jgi:hypothetical protein